MITLILLILLTLIPLLSFSFQISGLRRIFTFTTARSITMFEDRLNIGNDVEIAKLGIGTWAWGDKFFWKYKAEEDENLQASFNYLVDKGVNFFDTAEIYGIGKSELLLGRFLRQYEAKEKRVEIGTKSVSYTHLTLPTIYSV